MIPEAVKKIEAYTREELIALVYEMAQMKLLAMGLWWRQSRIPCDCASRGYDVIKKFMQDGEAEVRHVTRSYGKGANLLIIENVPVVVCPNCGESYLTAETLHEIERIKLHRKNLAKKRSIAVAEFVEA